LKIAWFTPVTGHAPMVEYSREVLAAMAQLCEPVLCCDRAPDGFPIDIPVMLLTEGSQPRPDAWSVDAVFYALGNDLEQHAWIYETSLEHTGIIVLRDRTLHPFFLSYYLDDLHRPDLYVTRMAEYYGLRGLAAAQRVLGPWFNAGVVQLELEDMLRFTFTEDALRWASGVVVDSRDHGSLVRRLWSGAVHDDPLPAEGERSEGDRPMLQYAEGLLRFAQDRTAGTPVDRVAEAQSRAVAEQMSTQIGTILASIGAKPDSPEVEAVISEAARLLRPAAIGEPRR